MCNKEKNDKTKLTNATTRRHMAQAMKHRARHRVVTKVSQLPLSIRHRTEAPRYN